MPKTSLTITESYNASRISSSAGGEIAVIINADRGRTDKVYTVESAEQFDQIFGTGTNSTEAGACKFLLNRGNVLKIVRTAVSGDEASVNFYKDAAETGTSYLLVKAVAAGTSYTGIYVVLTKVDTDVFSVTIKASSTGSVLESYSKVTLDVNSPYYVGNIESELVTFTPNGLSANDSLFLSTAVVGDEVSGSLSGGTGTPGATKTAYATAAELLKNRDIMFTTFVVPGMDITNWYGTGGIVQDLVDYRKDFLALPDFPAATTTVSAAKTAASSVTNEYTAVYYPRVKTSLSNSTPVSLLMADAIANLHKRMLQYKAPAGTVNGVLADAYDVVADLSESEVADLQQNKINPIIPRPGVGIVAWGQDTRGNPVTSVAQVAVRLLANYFKRNIYQISMNYMFRENNEFTWNDWIGEVEPMLRDVANVGGIVRYRVECGETTMTPTEIQSGIFKAKVAFQPVGYITEILIDFTIDQTGVTFEEE